MINSFTVKILNRVQLIPCNQYHNRYFERNPTHKSTMKTTTEANLHGPCNTCKVFFESYPSDLKGFVSPPLLIKIKIFILKLSQYMHGWKQHFSHL